MIRIIEAGNYALCGACALPFADRHVPADRSTGSWARRIAKSPNEAGRTQNFRQMTAVAVDLAR